MTIGAHDTILDAVCMSSPVIVIKSLQASTQKNLEFSTGVGTTADQ